MINNNQIIVSRLRVNLILTGMLSLAVTSFQLQAEEIEHLYIEDGVQISKVAHRNAMGAEVIEYVKNRINQKETQQLTQSQTEEPLGASAEQQTVKDSVIKGDHTEIKNSRSQLAQFEPIKEVKLPEEMPQKGLAIKAENSSGNEKALLKRVKALKAAKEKMAAYEDEDLNLAPGEQLVEDKDKKIIKPTQTKAKLSKKSRRPEDAIISRLEFNQASILDVARAFADISGLNFVATEAASKKNVTVFLQNISVINALEAVTKNTGLWFRKDKNSGTFRIMTTEEYQRDLVVYREDITRVFNLLHPNPVNVATAVSDLYGDRVILSYGADYDDFNTGDFNSGGSGSSANRGSSLGAGQSGLRRGVTSGLASRNASNRSNNNSSGNRKATEKQAGTAGNMAITEQLSASQLERLEEVLQVDENGDLVVKDAIRGISRAQQPIYITISRQQNLMIVRTSDTVAVKEIENLVKAMDKPTQQVLLEMQILEVDVGDAYNQLFSFSALSKDGKSLAFTREDVENSGSGKFVYQFIDDLIGLKLELLEKNNQAKTVSSPVLLASNNRTARLFVGEERLLVRGATLSDAVLNQNGILVTPARLTYETEIRNVGNTLNITPKINADGTVTLGIFQDTSTVNEDAVDFPPLVGTNGQVVNISLDTVNTANIEGVVVAKDGLTVAIGGLISSAASKEESKVPVLGDLPIVGFAFKDKVESVSRKEMVLLITPHIMTEPSTTDDISRDVVEPLSTQQW